MFWQIFQIISLCESVWKKDKVPQLFGGDIKEIYLFLATWCSERVSEANKRNETEQEQFLHLSARKLTPKKGEKITPYQERKPAHFLTATVKNSFII